MITKKVTSVKLFALENPGELRTFISFLLSLENVFYYPVKLRNFGNITPPKKRGYENELYCFTYVAFLVAWYKCLNVPMIRVLFAMLGVMLAAKCS